MNIPKNISVGIRWALALIVIAGSLLWLYEAENTMAARADSSSVRQPDTPEFLPSVQTMQQIGTLLSTVTNLPDAGTRLASMDASLFFAPSLVENADQLQSQAVVQNNLRLIFVGPETRYALYNGQVVKPGDSLVNGGRVLQIDKSGISVVNSASESVKRILWQSPGYVRFTKAPPVAMQLTKSTESRQDVQEQPSVPPTALPQETAQPKAKSLHKIAQNE
jgi:hypothetical protein